MKQRILSFGGFLIYLGLITLPIIMAANTALSKRPLLDEFSSAMAMLAFNIILLEFLTSGRITWLSRAMGVDWVLQIHQLFSRTAILLLLAHPFLYSLPSHPNYAPGLPNDSYLGMTGSTLMSGLLGLITLGVLVGLAMTRNTSKGSYESWRASHAVMALIVATAGLHHTLQAGRYAQEKWIMHYWQFAFAIAILSLIWGYVIQPLIQKSHPYEVKSIKQVAYNIWQLTIRSIHPRTHFNYRAGQFTWLKLHSAHPLHENPFTISSSPKASADEISFIIKDLGDFTHQVTELTPGNRVYVSSPHGNFGELNLKDMRNDNTVIMIAGGVGIAPMISLLKEMAATLQNVEKPIHLIYGNRIESQIIDLSAMVNLKAFKNLTVTHIVSEPSHQWSGITGVLDQATLKLALEKTNYLDDNTRYLVCGAAEMIDGVEYALEALSVKTHQIDSEKFQYDFTQKTARIRHALINWGLGSMALLISALFFSRT